MKIANGKYPERILTRSKKIEKRMDWLWEMNPHISSKKVALAAVLRYSGIEGLLFNIGRFQYGRAHIKAVGYHSVTSLDVSNFRRQMDLYMKHYSPVSMDDLNNLLVHGQWQKTMPGIIISFDDGLLDNYRVAAPILEDYGVRGLFFVPSDFINQSPVDQKAYADEHRIMIPGDYKGNGRLAMTWNEIADLAKRGHMLGSHTHSHCRFYQSVPPEQMQMEMSESKRLLEESLKQRIHVFAWVGGETETYNSTASYWIAKVGYALSFTTIPMLITHKTNPFLLGRTEIEADWPLSIVKFQLCGMMDFLYTLKRRKVFRTIRDGIKAFERS
ncbi:MAG: polysaccharide deacetylase family protein [Candidatus Omnitrophica bacterium]|nr:polysaccharide deacetylase family protein [Candidatus Omnitrophota bacterium]